jgi:hypothetical protein
MIYQQRIFSGANRVRKNLINAESLGLREQGHGQGLVMAIGGSIGDLETTPCQPPSDHWNETEFPKMVEFAMLEF